MRDRAVHLLVEVYKHVGDRLRMDLEKKNLLPDASKRKVIFQKFEEAKQNDLMKVASSPTTPHDPAAELNGEVRIEIVIELIFQVEKNILFCDDKPHAFL